MNEWAENGEGSWLDDELAAQGLRDKRLVSRLRRLLDRFSSAPGQPVPAACGDWAATKAAYRFFDNPRVTEHGVLAGHFAATQARACDAKGPILVLQDTTEFHYKRDAPEKIGFIKTINGGNYKAGQPNVRTLCGMLMHSSLAVTTAGVPLGLSAVKFWTRDKFKGTVALKRHINPTRMPIESKESYRWLENLRQSTELLGASGRCVHVGDRESDIYELFCLAQDLGTHFLVRVQTNRLAEPPSAETPSAASAHRVFDQLAMVPWVGNHDVVVDGEDGKTVSLRIKFASVETLPPVGKQKRYHPQTLTYIHALEDSTPTDRERIDWKLVTNLPVNNFASAVEKLRWYAMRWKIEVFHKIMKSGLRAEDAKLRTAERLVKLLALMTVVGWRIFWITMSARAHPDAGPETVLTPHEIAALDQINATRARPHAANQSLATYVLLVAMLGGYLARRRDPPPGNMVIWRGLTRLNDIVFGINIATQKRCG
jgi:hypothetical protein